MATYTTDLQTFNLLEASFTALEFTNYTAGRTQSLDADYPIQGNNHASAILAVVGQGSIAIDYGSNITWTSGWNFFLWGTFLAPAAIDTRANGGAVLLIGAGLGDYRGYYIGGNDFGTYPYGGWQNFVSNPEVTPSITLGTPGTSYRYVGIGHKAITAVAKGSPQGLDAIRYGRGELRVAGTSADFAGMATANDDNLARWGLFRSLPGGYQMKGLIVLGYGASTTFSDSDKNIVIDNTLFVASSFNGIELRNASSSITWININISALGTVSKGYLSMIDNCTFSDTGGIFADMDTFTYQSNATITGRTFRRCGLVTQGGATFSGCIFDDPTGTVALLVNDLSEVTGNTFISDGTGHAVNLGTITTTQSLTWSNTLTGYATSNGSTGNEALLVHVNTGVTLTINVSGGTSPYYYNTGPGSVVIAASVPISVEVVDSNNAPILTASVNIQTTGGTAIANGNVNGTTGIYTTSYSGSTPVAIVLRVRSSSSGETRYFPVKTGGTIASTTGLVTTITMQVDNIVGA